MSIRNSYSWSILFMTVYVSLSVHVCVCVCVWEREYLLQPHLLLVVRAYCQQKCPRVRSCCMTHTLTLSLLICWYIPDDQFCRFSQSLSLSLFVQSVSVSVSACLPLSLFVQSVSVSAYLPLSLFVQSVSVTVSACLPLSLFVQSVSVSLCSVSLCLSLFSLSLSLPACLCLSLSFLYLSLSLSASHSASFFLCSLTLSLTLFLSLYLKRSVILCPQRVQPCLTWHIYIGSCDWYRRSECQHVAFEKICYSALSCLLGAGLALGMN